MIINKRAIWYSLSSLLLIISLYGIFYIGLPFGLDFTGGNIAEVSSNESINTSDISAKLDENNISNSVQATGNNQFIIKFSSNEEESGGIPSQNKLTELFDNQITVNKFDSIGPTVSLDLQRKASKAVLLSIFGIILYVAWAFRGASKTTSAWSLGIIAVIALIHDTVIVAGLFSVINHFTSIRLVVDTYFITALLTIIGYSVNDTIVIFDRMRELIRVNPGLNLEESTEKAVLSTMARSLNTSFTVLIVIISMILLGGSSLFSFLFALLIGVIVGTYSSIFVAAPLFVSWNNFLRRRSK